VLARHIIVLLSINFKLTLDIKDPKTLIDVILVFGPNIAANNNSFLNCNLVLAIGATAVIIIESMDFAC